MKKYIIPISTALGILLLVLLFRSCDLNGTGTPKFKTRPVSRGDLRITISATGTLEPEEVVDVGAQVAGQILAFGKDASGNTVDYGSLVEKGTVLTMIDQSLYECDLEAAEAQVQAAVADRQRANTEFTAASAQFEQATRDWERVRKLAGSHAMAQTKIDAIQSAYKKTQADVAGSQAAIQQKEAGLALAQANLKRMQKLLGYCTITSPVKGVIIDRRVDIGQTVVASLDAPSLFLLAKDLERMQLWVAVNEADIGKIKAGQQVSFAVDALPDEKFEGRVNKIRLNASMTQNVVMYTVEVTVDNSDRKLLPYLTANVQFEVALRNDVLLVPNAALSWSPTTEQVHPDYRRDNEQKQPAPPKPGDSISGAPPPGQAGGMSDNQRTALYEIVAKFNPQDFTAADFRSMTDEFKKAEIHPSPAVGSLLKDAGFETDQFIKNSEGGPDGRPQGGPPGNSMGGTPPPTAEGNPADDRAVLWVKEGRFVRPVHVQKGVSNGVMTEVQGEDIMVGMDIVIGVQKAPASGQKKNEEQPVNPWLPDPPDRSNQGGGGPPSR